MLQSYQSACMRRTIQSVGFDLDNTLFKPNATINEYIRSYACRRASEILSKPYNEVRTVYNEHYEKCQSSRRSLRAMGIEDVDTIMQNSLEQEEIVALLQKDEALNGMLKRLARRYALYLITTNAQNTSLRKLDALGIDANLFSPKIYELGNKLHKRLDGSAFHYVSELHGVDLSEMFFVGDREQTDILPAKKLGLMTAIVNTKSLHAHYQLEDIYQLEELLA